MMAEVKLHAQCDVRTASALTDIRDNVIKLSEVTLGRFGDPLSFASVSFKYAPTESTADAMDKPCRELRIEPLREEPRCAYIELMSQWAQVAIAQAQVDLKAIRPIKEQPSEYVNETHEFLQEWVNALASEQGEAE